MAHPPPDPTPQLSTLNGMISLALGSSVDRTGEIQAALDFLSEQHRDKDQHHTPPKINRSEMIRNLVHLHVQNPESFGFRLWDLSREQCEPLWLRAHLLRELRRLSGYRDALLLVIGLRQSICPPGKYWTTARAAHYRRTLAYIENQAVRFKTPCTRLNILFA